MLIMWSKLINNALFPTLVTTLPEYALPTPDRRLSKNKPKKNYITPSTAYPHITTGPTNPPVTFRVPQLRPQPPQHSFGPSASLAAGLSLAASVALGGSARSGLEATPAVDADHGESESHRRRRRGRPHADGKVQQGAGHPASALRRCFSTLPKNVRRQDHGAERRALNSISNQIDLRKIHWLANPGKVIRGALLYAVGLGWSACGETLRPARRPDRGHRVAATQRTKRVAPPGRAARHDARRARRRRRPVCCMGGDRGRAARLRGRAPRPRRRACSNARACGIDADAARPHDCMSRRSIRLGMSHRPINALSRP